MARLNEPPLAPSTGLPPGSESIDILKRRFIRQNRELAKVNSTQSLRIRSLENEVNRLQSDNLQLQEQVIELKAELCSTRGGFANVDLEKLQDQLSSKLSEMAGLINGLGCLERHAPQMELLPRDRVLSPSRRQYRERQALSELMRDAQMPTIRESTSFARESMSADELRALRYSDHSSNDSPNLGPPPITHFEHETTSEPCASPTHESPRPKSPKPQDENILNMIPSVNLETRRRRRTSDITPSEPRRCSILALSPHTTENETGTTILRAGAKRKLADRETSKPVKYSQVEDFSYSRKTNPEKPQSAYDEACSTETYKTEDENIDRILPATSSPMRSPRKALAAKSVNLSPRKAVSKPDDLKKDPIKNPISKASKPPTRAPARAAKPIPLTEILLPPTSTNPLPDLPLDPLTADLSPNTPATDDVFSPLSSGPPPHARDTPPPADLSAISNTTEGSQRPSRRARSLVNYAEPSLVAKMRRPGKQMVDAISGLQDPRSAMSLSGKQESRIHGSKHDADSEGSIFQSHNPGSAALDSHSPLRNKSSTTTTDLLHPAAPVPPQHPQQSIPLNDLNPSVTLSTLLPPPRKRPSTHPKPPIPSDPSISTTAHDHDHDPYALNPSSSPAETSTGDPTGNPAPPSPHTIRVSRRHSSAIKNPRAVAERADAEVPARAAAAAGVRTAGVASRRRSMML